MKAQKPQASKGGVWQRLLNAMSKKVGEIVGNDELIKVSGQHNYARRIRELRAEGWDIVYSPSPMGYTLRTNTRADKNTDVYINLKLRSKVLERDSYTCQRCFHKAGEKYSDGEIVRMEVDHIDPLKNKGRTVEENLWALCSRCNAGKKSLLDYPETAKNRILSINLSDDVRQKLSKLAKTSGRTVNDLVIEAINKGIKML